MSSVYDEKALAADLKEVFSSRRVMDVDDMQQVITAFGETLLAQWNLGTARSTTAEANHSSCRRGDVPSIRGARVSVKGVGTWARIEAPKTSTLPSFVFVPSQQFLEACGRAVKCSTAGKVLPASLRSSELSLRDVIRRSNFSQGNLCSMDTMDRWVRTVFEMIADAASSSGGGKRVEVKFGPAGTLRIVHGVMSFERGGATGDEERMAEWESVQRFNKNNSKTRGGPGSVMLDASSEVEGKEDEEGRVALPEAPPSLLSGPESNVLVYRPPSSSSSAAASSRASSVSSSVRRLGNRPPPSHFPHPLDPESLSRAQTPEVGKLTIFHSKLTSAHDTNKPTTMSPSAGPSSSSTRFFNVKMRRHMVEREMEDIESEALQRLSRDKMGRQPHYECRPSPSSHHRAPPSPSALSDCGESLPPRHASGLPQTLYSPAALVTGGSHQRSRSALSHREENMAPQYSQSSQRVGGRVGAPVFSLRRPNSSAVEASMEEAFERQSRRIETVRSSEELEAKKREASWLAAQRVEQRKKEAERQKAKEVHGLVKAQMEEKLAKKLQSRPSMQIAAPFVFPFSDQQGHADRTKQVNLSCLEQNRALMTKSRQSKRDRVLRAKEEEQRLSSSAFRPPSVLDALCENSDAVALSRRRDRQELEDAWRLQAEVRDVRF